MKEQLFEAEVVPGLKSVALAEMERLFGREAAVVPGDEVDAILFRYGLSPQDLHQLRTVTAVSLVLPFAVPRPKALLGDQHFRRLRGQLDRVRGMHPSGSFQSFRFDAAGRQSSVFQRLQAALSDYTHMRYELDEADLRIRVRPARSTTQGWEVLIRTTPRPLTTRPWRVCNMLGALNATVAAAMIQLTGPQPDDRFFNPMCGSGTLLIERLAHGPTQVAGGCDLDSEALACARENVAAAGYERLIDLFNMDAGQLEIGDALFDAFCVNLPWGHRTGTHEGNINLYPRVLAELTRVAAPGARLALLTHEISLIEQLLAGYESQWQIQQVIRVLQGGLYPRIYLLHRRSN